MNNPGLTIEVFNGEGELTQGTSFPNNLAKLAHEQGTCGFECGWCYQEACDFMDGKL